MWSRTWAIALAIVSRLTVTDCLGPPPPLHKPHVPAAAAAAAVSLRDPDGEIDAAYRTREELVRQNALRHLKLRTQNNGNSIGEDVRLVEYPDDVITEPRHRYHENEHRPRQRIVTHDEKPPDTTNDRRHGHQRSKVEGHDHPEEQPRGNPPPAEEGNLVENVQIRSGVESFQPIAAAMAMQENLKALDDAYAGPSSPPPPPRQPPQPPEVRPMPPNPPLADRPVDSGSSENEILRPGFDREEEEEEGQVAPKGYQAVALQQGPKFDGDSDDGGSLTEVYFLAVIAGCSVAGFIGLVLAGVFYYRLRKKMKAASDAEYPAYGVTGPNKEREGGGAPGDRMLAQSAQMYHYQHQKQQMIASERLNSDVNHRGGSDAESEDENEEGDYTVFECPGLATNGDMEVRNPLFSEQTPVTAPSDAPGTPQGKK